MNHRRVYEAIIEKYRNAKLEPGMYTEKHHIVPRSLGGTDAKSNLVVLPARVHYVCHQLLVRMYEGEAKSKMWFALWCVMNVGKQPAKSSFQYERARIESGKAHSNRQRLLVQQGQHPMQGGAIARKAVLDGTHNWLGGKLQSEQVQKQLATGTHPWQNKEWASQREYEKIKNGTHQLIGTDIVSKTQRRLVEEGRHHMMGGDFMTKSWKNDVTREKRTESIRLAALLQQAKTRIQKGEAREGDEIKIIELPRILAERKKS